MTEAEDASALVPDTVAVERIVEFASKLCSLERTWWDSTELTSSTHVDYYRFAVSQPGFGVLPRLAQEAVSPAHPAHQLFKDRFRWRREMLAKAFGCDQGLDTKATPDQLAGTVSSLWDGAFILNAHVINRPARDTLIDALTADLAKVAGPPDISYDVVMPPPATPTLTPGADRLVTLFAENPPASDANVPHDLDALAELLGVEPAQVSADFRSVDEFVLATFVRYGETNTISGATEAVRMSARPLELIEQQLRWIDDMAATRPTMLRWWTWLLSRSIQVDNVAHRAMQFSASTILRATIRSLRRLDQLGSLRPYVRPTAEAFALTSINYGLGLQWAYDPEDIDVASYLRRHLEWLTDRDPR